MRKIGMFGSAVLGLALLSGCAAPIPPSEVTRFHVGQPIGQGTIAIRPRAADVTPGLEFETYASAISRELRGRGFTIVPQEGSSEYVALVEVSRTSRAIGEPRSRFSIGLGGGSYGGGVGVGGGLTIPVGKKSSVEQVKTELFVQIRKRSADQPLWEGRADLEARDGTPYASATSAVDKLAAALFKDFPGESGRTITVP